MTTPRRTRTLRSPKERAEETLAIAERAVARLGGKRDKAKAELDEIETELVAAERRLEHARLQPDLQDEDETPLPFGEGET